MMIEVEHHGRESRGAKDELQKYLEGVGYKLYKKLSIDDIYIKNDFVLPKSLKQIIQVHLKYWNIGFAINKASELF